MNSMLSSQTETRLSEELHVQESDNNITAPAQCSLNHPQHVIAASCEQTQQAPSLAPSAPTQSDHSDISAADSLTPSSPNLVLSNDASMTCPPPLRVSESLGLEGCAGIIGGFVGILGVFGFLAFLWFGGKQLLSSLLVSHCSLANHFLAGSVPEAANATWVWRQLALRNWMPRAVTLTSIILRFIVGTQATICTSMIAALLLERLSVPRSQAARASIMRGINDGPWKLVVLLTSYKRKASYILRHLEPWLIMLVALLGLSLQFTSTILLSDMHSFTMIGDPNITTVKGLYSFPGQEKFTLYECGLMNFEPIYPVFGEVPTPHNSTPDSRGFSDTGLTQRGLLPMSDRDFRTSVREYDGMGMVMSSQVACMRPAISDASIYIELGRFGRLQGNLNYNKSLQDARPGTGPLCSLSEQCEQVVFDCQIPATLWEIEKWATGGCDIVGVGGNFRDLYKPAWDPETGPWSENSSVWLIYSTTMGVEQWQSMPRVLPMPPGDPLGDSEWTIYEVVPGYFIKFSVCFAAFNFAYRDIRMTAAGATTEPSTPWSLVLDEAYNLEEVQTYLGLNPSHQSATDRGILDLQIQPNGTASDALPTDIPPMYDIVHLPTEQISPSALTVDTLQLELNYALTNGNTTNTSFGLCYRCSNMISPTHQKYAFLFSSILSGESPDDGRAADALHAFLNIAGFNVYEQFLANSMDVAEQVRVVTTRMVTVPGSWPPSMATSAGFITVASLLAAYITLVPGITVLYVRRTRYSRHGNVWHVISQLVASTELEETLELGNNASDKAVVEGLRTKESSKEDVLVKLEKIDGENIKVEKLGTK